MGTERNVCVICVLGVHLFRQSMRCALRVKLFTADISYMHTHKRSVHSAHITAGNNYCKQSNKFTQAKHKRVIRALSAVSVSVLFRFYFVWDGCIT